MGVLVVSLNPAIDAEWRVAEARWEEKNLIESERRWAGGKGINVARWLRHLGSPPRLLLPLGGERGRELTRGLKEQGLAASAIPVKESSRINVVVTTAEGRQIRFNQPGPRLSGVEWRAILRETKRLLPKISCIIFSGSLPRGLPANAYAAMIRLAHRAGVKAVLDCDGPALRAGVKARPLLVKPNLYELGQWAGRELKSETEIVRTAGRMASATGGWVLVSRGHEGAVLVPAEGHTVWFARPPRLQPVSTVGAGDALLAAAVTQIEEGADPREWLRWGVATGAAATQSTGGRLPKRALVRELAAGVTLRMGRK